jgi:hypothetical protein
MISAREPLYPRDPDAHHFEPEWEGMCRRFGRRLAAPREELRFLSVLLFALLLGILSIAAFS